MGKRAERRKKFEAEDDGRTIVDMSCVERPGVSGLFGAGEYGQDSEDGRRARRSGYVTFGQEENAAQDFEAPLFSRRERRMYVLGALKAALLIGLAYLVGLGVLIGLLTAVWR